MEAQVIYDTVCTHLAQQKTRSMDGEECRYRGVEGKMCAVGCLIPDELFDPEMDSGGGLSAQALLRDYPLVAKHVGKENANILQGLQDAHDYNRDGISLRRALERVATVHNLTPGAEQAITEWS